MIWKTIFYQAQSFFAGDTSLFSIVNYINYSANYLSNGLSKIRYLAFRWKMSFRKNIILHYISIILLFNKYHHKNIKVCCTYKSISGTDQIN